MNGRALSGSCQSGFGSQGHSEALPVLSPSTTTRFTRIYPVPTRSGMEGGISASSASLPFMGDNSGGHSKREDDMTLLARFVQGFIGRKFASKCDRLVADALKEGVAELRKDEEARITG